MPVKTPIVHAKDVMRRNVVAIDGMATVREAVAKMRSENVTALIVSKRELSNRLCLIVIPARLCGGSF